MITPEELEKERVKSLKLLENNFEMYENTKKDTLRKLKQKMLPDGTPFYTQDDIDKQMKLIQGMQDDIVEKYLQQGGDPARLDEIRNKRRSSPDKGNKPLTVYDKTNVISAIEEYLKNKPADTPAKAKPVQESEPVQTVKPNQKSVIPSTPVSSVIDVPEAVNTVSGIVNRKKKNVEETGYIEPTKEATNTSWNTNSTGNGVFDVIPLPSKGQCYPSKIDRIPVSFLTAYDENMLVSPNLYRDGTVLDYIIRNKVREDAGINPDNLVSGDRDAVILWLRATGYGNEFPITVTDTDSGKDFDTVVDLSKINFKDFNLVGDENGWFDFTTPVRKDVLKFRFLTARDNKLLESLEEKEQKKGALGKIRAAVEEIETLMKDDASLTKDDKKKIFEAQNTLTDWTDRLLDEGAEEQPFTNAITNRMEIMIMAINGETSREYIHNYVNNMNVRDSSAFRRYVAENEPGLDYNLEVERPESLGGGSITVFLQLDQYLFLNIA